MEKKYTKAMSKAMIMSLILTAAIPKTIVQAATGQVTRLGENDSYATAAKVATTNWSNSKNVVLVCGEGYADAVSATVLAKKLDAPILLTTANYLNESAKSALDTIKPEKIYIIGGSASISDTVRNKLKNSSYSLIELGGKNRYETNVAVANELIKLGVKADNVMLVGGDGFSDTLSVTSVAATKGQILLLGTNNNTTMQPVLDFVKANNSKVTVVGTNYSINDATYKALGAVERVNGGSNRFETNLNVLDKFSSDLKLDKLFIANASGDRYTDALIASSLAGKWTSPLVLVDTDNSPDTNKALNYIKGKINTSTDLNVVGGSEAVSEGVVSKINSLTPNNDSATVKSVTTNGLNQVKVVFNTEVDKDTAELISNYQIDGSNLGSVSQTDSAASLQDDNRTVLINFAHPFEQYKEVEFSVKNTITDKNFNNGIAKYDQKITFSSTNQPVLESVTSKGGNKLVVKFSEPIRMGVNDLSSMKINRQSIDSYGFDKSTTEFKGKSGDWADKVEIYFDSPLPEGNNTFSIPAGDKGKRFDNAAGFCVKGTSLNFNINNSQGTPTVKSVTSDSSGNIYITYDRPMDKQTALEDTNYKLNGSTIYVGSSNIVFDDGANDSVVKIKGLSYTLKEGENELLINHNIEDTYGNQINETKTKFNYGNDTTKPVVSNVSLVDSKTIRVKFNKDVLNSYATNKSNYKLVDQDGSDITYKIDNITAVYLNGNSQRNFDIKFTDKDRLRGAKYTITIKNVIDTNSKANVMDEYNTSFSGVDDEDPNVVEIVKRVDEDQTAVIFFNKVMDEESITNPSNYQFMNGMGDARKLPASTVLTMGLDGKSVNIQFPSGYVVGDGKDEKHVLKLSVANVKDKYGNSLSSGSYNSTITADYNSGPSIVDGTAKLTYDGDDIKVRFSLSEPLDILNSKDFRVNGQSPDTGLMIGNDVILTFKAGVNNGEKVNSIRNAGENTTLNVININSADAAGRRIKYGSTQLLLPPITVPESWRADSNIGSGKNSTVTIAFNQEIDSNVKSSYYDDFIFTNERTGQRLNVLSVGVEGKNVIYKFNNGTINSGDRINVRATSEIANINIRSKESSKGDYSVYSPSRDDLKDKTLTAH